MKELCPTKPARQRRQRDKDAWPKDDIDHKVWIAIVPDPHAFWPTEPAGERVAPEDEIDRLYDTLACLNANLELNPDDAALKREIETAFRRLRELQENEAKKLSLEFQHSLSITPEAAQRAMLEARELLRKHANPPAPNKPTRQADNS